MQLSAPQNRVLDALRITEDAENAVFQNSGFGVSLGLAWDQCEGSAWGQIATPRRSSTIHTVTILHSNLQADLP